MRHSYYLFVMVGWALFLVACGGRGKASLALSGGDTLKLHWAKQLTIVDFPDYTVVTLRNPWDTLQTRHTYVLAPK